MGCHRCGRRQVDPESGPSTWRRGVAGGEQVLVCPDCQSEGWRDGLDRCAACGSTMLVKRLGEVTCRGCSATGSLAVGPDDGAASVRSSPGSRAVAGSGGPRAALAADVAAALDRVLRGE